MITVAEVGYTGGQRDSQRERERERESETEPERGRETKTETEGLRESVCVRERR